MLNQTKLAVVVPTSLSWLKFAVVALDSCINSVKSSNQIDFYLLVPDYSFNEATELLSKANFTHSVTICAFDTNALEGFPITNRWGEVSWYRTLLPSVKEFHRYDTLVLLGVDTFCLGSELNFFEVDFFQPIAAVQEPLNSPTYSYAPFKEVGGAYFNSDVLFYDTVIWNSEDLARKIQAFVANLDSTLPFADQDVMNLFFKESWGRLPAELNWIPALNNRRAFRQVGTSFIIQWAGKWKPWDSFLVPPISITRRWRGRYKSIWNDSKKKSNLGLSNKLPTIAMVSFYVPSLFPFVLIPQRIYEKLRLLRRRS